MPELRVATLNLFNNPAGRWGDRVGLVAEQAIELEADVLAFQECDLEGAQVRSVVDALGETYTFVPLANPASGSIKSLAVATRLPVESSDACVDLGSADVALRVRVDAGGVAVDIVTTHLHFGPSRRGSEIRAAQLQRLLAWLGPVGDHPLAVMGDFNGGAGGATVAAMKAVLRSAHEAVPRVYPSDHLGLVADLVVR